MAVRKLALLALITLSTTCYGQYGASLGEIAGVAELTIGQAMWLAGSASASVSALTSIEEARAALLRASITPPPGSDDEPITLGHYSLLLMRLFELRGGFWYGLVPSPLTAMRVLQARVVVPGFAHSGEFLSGEAAIRMIRQVLRLVEAQEAGCA